VVISLSFVRYLCAMSFLNYMHDVFFQQAWLQTVNMVEEVYNSKIIVYNIQSDPFKWVINYLEKY